MPVYPLLMRIETMQEPARGQNRDATRPDAAATGTTPLVSSAALIAGVAGLVRL